MRERTYVDPEPESKTSTLREKAKDAVFLYIIPVSAFAFFLQHFNLDVGYSKPIAGAIAFIPAMLMFLASARFLHPSEFTFKEIENEISGYLNSIKKLYNKVVRVNK